MRSGGEIDAIRQFNRFYTRRIGVLEEGLLDSRFSLTEVRVLYELAERDGLTATDLGEVLGIDAGYLSRMLAGFRRRGLVARERARHDQRQIKLKLTRAGKKAFAPLDARAQERVSAMLTPLSEEERLGLVSAMRQIQLLLGGVRSQSGSLSLRPPLAGDLGWVVERHGALYAREYGWNAEFEKLAARIVADFREPRDRCWIADLGGTKLGSVFVIHESKTVARLRLLLVEPRARKLGIGGLLVLQCIRHGRAAGYRRLDLWTNDVLRDARRLYERSGFKLVREKKHESFGRKLVAQDWSLKL